MQGDDAEIGKTEQEPAFAIALRDGERHHQKAGHGRDQHQPHALGRVGVIGQPYIATIHPPDQHEHRERVQIVDRTMGLFHEMGDLGDGENEDQIEEEFDRLGAERRRVFAGGGHGISGLRVCEKRNSHAPRLSSQNLR